MLRQWLSDPGGQAAYFAPGILWKNGFNGLFRDEFLNEDEFRTLTETRADGGQAPTIQSLTTAQRTGIRAPLPLANVRHEDCGAE